MMNQDQDSPIIQNSLGSETGEERMEVDASSSNLVSESPEKDSTTLKGRVRKRLKELEEQLEAQKEEIESLKDRLLRLAAEYDNYRKRTTQEMRDLVQTASERVIKVLLPVLDDFHRLMDQDPEKVDSQTLRQGVELIFRKFQTVLQNEGLEPIPALGEKFDPHYHEAIAEMVIPGKPFSIVVGEIEKGYKLGNKVIRHSRVVVSKAPEEASSDGLLPEGTGG
ncbi:MAG: nucleotide exchange factor GrpE [bacterium]